MEVVKAVKKAALMAVSRVVSKELWSAEMLAGLMVDPKVAKMVEMKAVM